jgi:hypothetical protein
MDARAMPFFMNALAGSSFSLLNTLPILLALGNQHPEPAAPAGKPLSMSPASR